MEFCGQTSGASMAAGRRTFFGSKPAVALPTRRQGVQFRRHCKTQAILEKARDIIKPSNGASISSKPPTDPSSVQADVLQNLEYVVGAPSSKIPNGLDAKSVYRGVAASVREHLIDAFNRTQDYWSEKDPKFVYYLSAEFLMGRSLMNAVQNLELTGTYSEAVKQLGYDLETLWDAEQNAALGNGGLGRLAACFIDSMATLNLPGWGYGIRYKYGMFKQAIDDKGYQQELPDIWLSNGNPWEIPRPDITFKIGFYGTVDNFKWSPGETVIAKAYDNPIPGFKTPTVGNLRLWEALPVEEFDLSAFNEGKYDKAVEEARKTVDRRAELYPMVDIPISIS